MQPVLFNIFVDDMGSGIECILSRLAEGIMLNDTDDSLEGQDGVLRDFDRLEEAAHMKLMKVKEQCILTAQKARCILGCIKSMTSRSRELIFPFYFAFVRPLPGVLHPGLKPLIQVWRKKGHRLVRSSPEVDHKNYQMNEEPLL